MCLEMTTLMLKKVLCKFKQTFPFIVTKIENNSDRNNVTFVL